MVKSDLCPICNSKLNESRELPDLLLYFSCPSCGNFILPYFEHSILSSYIEKDKEARFKLSHAIRSMQSVQRNPKITNETIEEILKRHLPKPNEQADLLIRWLGENIDGPGEKVWVNPESHNSVVGAKSRNGFALIVNYLFDAGLVEGNRRDVIGKQGDANITLNMAGWKYLEELQTGYAKYRKAFMAMSFSNSELDSVLENVFKPCVKQTGFDLFALRDRPVAGLIDDRLRVEIQTSAFLVVDLSDDNAGAYWEAGYAEGLGKPVIYSCEKDKFDKDKTHFDTNHHLTVVWDKEDSKSAGEKLKATIRSTLPHLAKQND